MNILFFIGNGFDINLGIPTTYQEFYKYYRGVETKSDLIENLKHNIENNIENWADLELALGKYTSQLKSPQEFNETFEDIEDNLANYLEIQEEMFDVKQFDCNKIYNYLISPHNSLPPADRNKIQAFTNSQTSHYHINIITFNYTKTLETLLQYKDLESSLNTYSTLHKIEHVHGYTDKRMVMGVNDISQISNTKFHDNIEVIETLVKSECNKAQKHLVDEWCKNRINEANLICIFGSSIGETDKIWWQLIGNRLKGDCHLIIFEKGEKIPPRRLQKGKIAERKKKDYFLNLTSLKESEKKVIEDKIIVGINTKLFDKESMIKKQNNTN